MNQSQKPQDNNNKKSKNIIIIFALLLAFFSFSFLNTPKGPQEITLSKFLTQLERDQVKKVLMDEDQHKIFIELKDKTLYQAGYPVTFGKELTQQIIAKKNVELKGTINRPQSIVSMLINSLLPTLLIIGFLLYLFRKGSGLGGIAGLSSRKTTPVEVPTTRFSDIAGVDECVDELKEVVEILKNPDKFTKTGAKVPKGYLLVGSPGTGKTMLARAVAGEAGVPFYSISGSDFVEIFVGAGAKRVRELFDKARIDSQAILFIDEIDAIGRSRGGSYGAANDERENTLNQLLVEMDGFQSSGIIMMAATNRPDILDEALTRAGRFDRKIIVPVPDKKGREEIFKIHSRNKPVNSKIDFSNLARRTPGVTGADIANIVNEAALDAARMNNSQIEEVNFDNAIATTSLGRERRSASISDRDKEIVAYHEAGHTICALIQKDASDPVSVSIIPRGPAGGVTWLGGSDDQFMTRKQAFAQLVVSMGGRAAEEALLNDDFTQGAHGDLEGATNLALAMITKYGMGKNMVSLNSESMLTPMSVDINAEASQLISKALVEARVLIKKHKKLLTMVVDELLEKETLLISDIKEIEKKYKKSPSKSNSSRRKK